jgi:hypothetical protein
MAVIAYSFILCVPVHPGCPTLAASSSVPPQAPRILDCCGNVLPLKATRKPMIKRSTLRACCLRASSLSNRRPADYREFRWRERTQTTVRR